MGETRDIVHDLRNAGQPTMPSFGQPGDGGVPLMMEAAAEIERLRKALARFGSHRLACNKIGYPNSGSCDCGWDAARAVAGEEKE